MIKTEYGTVVLKATMGEVELFADLSTIAEAMTKNGFPEDAIIHAIERGIKGAKMTDDERMDEAENAMDRLKENVKELLNILMEAEKEKCTMEK